MKSKFLLFILFALAATAANAQFGQKDADEKYAVDLLKPGTEMPDFKLKDINGKTQKLSKLAKGKYRVIDFWASWCPDCRKDIPNVKRMYQNFSSKGVEFIGVSFDDNEEQWKNACEKYGLEYTQLSELKRMRDSDVAKSFGVKWIPSMMLFDKEGKVMLSTVLADKMERKLTELCAEEYPVPQKGTSERISIDGSKGKLAAILRKPVLQTGEQCPIVILCHGFSGNKNSKLFELIADSLANHGIASIRFDFNGHGESEGEFVDMTVPNEIEDALKVVEYVRDLRFVSKVAIAGHSQGGVVASMVAGKLEESDIAAVALLAPAAVLRDDAIRGNTMGAAYDPLDPPEFVNLYGNLKLGREYIKTAFYLPIYETAAKYHGPAMIIHGTADRVVPYTYGERFHQIWTSSDWILLDAFDHGFSQNEYRVADLTVDFFVKKLGNK